MPPSSFVDPLCEDSVESGAVTADTEYQEAGIAQSARVEKTATNDGLVWLVIALRRTLKRTGLLPLARDLRAIMVLGPWRVIPRFLIRQLRPAAPLNTIDDSVLTGILDPIAIAEEIHRNSIAIEGALPRDMTDRLRILAERLPAGEYQDMHRIDDDVRRLSEDVAIRNVLRSYFRCEPELIGATLDISSDESFDPKGLHEFHIDYPGWESLCVFVYLNDITSDKSYHLVAKGSHRRRGVKGLLRRRISDEEAQRRFGPSLQAVLGPAGTIFFENTEAYHRRQPGKEKRRALLKLTYLSHRGILTQGRGSKEQFARTARLVETVRATELTREPVL
ncbi:hypothetical protein F6455_08005 [Proteobacteria bacterium 005FR1]|nr:hypothetical protein [Proteobacteria bacterium 005FR1]